MRTRAMKLGSFLLLLALVWNFSVPAAVTAQTSDAVYLSRRTLSIMHLFRQFSELRFGLTENTPMLPVVLRSAAPFVRLFSPAAVPRNFRRGGGGSGNGGRGNSGDSASTPAVTLIAPTLGALEDLELHIGELPFALTPPTSNSAGAFSYTSSNTDVATVSGDTVTLVSDGTTVITATQAADGIYAAGSVTMTLLVLEGMCTFGGGENPCQNGGTCTNAPESSYICTCIGIYSGSECQDTDVNCNLDLGADLPCLNGGTCVPTSGGGRCECTADFCGFFCDEPMPSDLQCNS